MIDLRPGDERDRSTWSALLDLASAVDGWTLIGARMVQLHAAERGLTVARASFDADALADARDRNGTRRVSRALKGMRFALDPPTGFGLGHVFRKGGVEIDVLAPDGLHTKARRITVPPAHTVQVPGGTREPALQTNAGSSWVDRLTTNQTRAVSQDRSSALERIHDIAAPG